MITEDLSEYIAIALLVVHEKAKGKGSFWSSYIGVLPTVEDVRRGAVKKVQAFACVRAIEAFCYRGWPCIIIRYP